MGKLNFDVQASGLNLSDKLGMSLDSIAAASRAKQASGRLPFILLPQNPHTSSTQCFIQMHADTLLHIHCRTTL